MSQQKEIASRSFGSGSKQRKPVGHTCFSNVGQLDLSAQSVEGLAATSFTDAGNMSANTAIVKARSQRGPSCTVSIFR